MEGNCSDGDKFDIASENSKTVDSPESFHEEMGKIL